MIRMTYVPDVVNGNRPAILLTMTTFNLSDFKVGDNIQAFHPRMLGVVLYGRVIRVGRKYLHIDFGNLRGGVFTVSPANVTENWGEG